MFPEFNRMTSMLVGSYRQPETPRQPPASEILELCVLYCVRKEMREIVFGVGIHIAFVLSSEVMFMSLQNISRKPHALCQVSQSLSFQFLQMERIQPNPLHIYCILIKF
jgi:hypothetical protein